MKKLTISDIKDILRIELEKSKRHVQHYYLGTNQFSETDRLKSLLSNQEQEDQFRDKLKQNYRQTLKELNPKVHQVLEEQGYDPEPVDSLEFKQLREKLIQLKLDQFEQKRVLLSGKPDNTEEVEPPHHPTTTQTRLEPTEEGSITLSVLCKDFIQSREERGLTLRSIRESKSSTDLFLEIIGDIPVSTLSHSDGRKFVQTIKRIPKNRNSRFPNQTID